MTKKMSCPAQQYFDHLLRFWRQPTWLCGMLIAVALIFCGEQTLAQSSLDVGSWALISQMPGVGSFGFGLRLVLLVAALLLLPAKPLLAAVYYVRKTGDDGNAGTSAGAAWATFDKATSATSAGDIVYFGAGTYEEKVEPSVDGTNGSPIQFIADTDGTQTGDAGSVVLKGVNAKDGKAATAIKLDNDDYLEFDGSNSVTIPDPGEGASAFSVSDWIKSDDLSDYDNDYGAGIARSTHGESVGDWVIAVDKDGSLYFYHWTESGADSDGIGYTADGVITASTWYHIVVTWDETTPRMFVNGVETTPAGTKNTDSGWGDANEIGQIWPESKYQFDGLIDDFKIYSRAICADEIDNLYGSGTSGRVRVIKWLEVR